MSEHDTARALKLIESELGHLPTKADREKKADEILGALKGEFLIAPWPKDEDVEASRAQFDALVPGMFDDKRIS